MVEKKGILVRDLIVQLQALDPDLECLTEGCDCYGECGGAEELAPGRGGSTKDRQVLLTRYNPH